MWLLFQRKQACMYHACVCEPRLRGMISTWITNYRHCWPRCLCLQLLCRKILFYHHAAPAYMRRRKDKFIIQRTVTVPAFSSAISPPVFEITLLTELWFQRNGEKTFACLSRSAQCGRSWMLSQRWPARCINVKWRGKTPESHRCVWIILTSCFCHYLPGTRLALHQHTERAWSEGALHR